MTCKDCEHFEACDTIMYRYGIGNPHLNPLGSACHNFKDKNTILQLPCPVGNPVYIIVEKRAKASDPAPFRFIKKSRLTFYNMERCINEFGKTVFLTLEQAEAALAVMK